MKSEFLSRTVISGNCVVWIGEKTSSGVGRFRFRGIEQLAHRYSYFLEHGELPIRNHVVQSCGNKLCVNPKHLVLLSKDRVFGFWRHVKKTPTCWLWTGNLCAPGYGIYKPEKNKPAKSAHRMVWEMNYGNIPPGLLVCHKCDVRNCVRPDHLFLGTQLDNNRDAKNKGRHCHAETHGMAKLKWKQVNRIRQLRKMGWKLREIADVFGVTQQCVWQIVHLKHWKSYNGANAGS